MSRKSRGKSRSKSRLRKNIECHYCHKFGHYKKDCFKLKKKKKKMLEENLKMRNLRLSVLQKKPSHHMRFFQLLSLMPVQEMSGFLIQVVLITYVCPHRGWFVTYQPIDDGNVLMRNNMPSKTIGIVSIKIRMHDSIVRTLSNVRHVPDLKKI